MPEFTRDMLFGDKPSSDNTKEQTTDIAEVESQVTDMIEFSVDTTTIEILKLKNQTCMNIIEIGKKLTIAKENIEHGEFEKWLEGKVEFSKRTATNFMRIAREFSNEKQVADLGTRKLLLLAGIDSEEREEFMQENNVIDMTTSELNKAIKDKKKDIPKEKLEPKFTGRIKKDTFKKYKDRFNTNDDFDSLIDKLLSEYFENN